MKEGRSVRRKEGRMGEWKEGRKEGKREGRRVRRKEGRRKAKGKRERHNVSYFLHLSKGYFIRRDLGLRKRDFRVSRSSKDFREYVADGNSSYFLSLLLNFI